MRRSTKALLVVAGILAALAALTLGYRAKYSMRPAHAFEVGSRDAPVRVLIATQGSEFKDAVVQGLQGYLVAHSAYGRVIDVAMLPSVREDEWTAIVILHTWEVGKPPPRVAAFIDRVTNRTKIVALATSGRGDFRIDGIDSLSSASRDADVPLRTAEITARLDHLLAAAGTQPRR